MPFKILVDTVQRRVAVPSVSTLASGEDWDLAATSTDLYIDPATHTLMCKPGAWYADWQTSNTGIFAKLPRSAFTWDPATGWSDVDPQVNAGDGPFYLLSDNTAGVKGISNDAMPVNQAMVVEWFNPPQTPTSAVAGECGWSNTGSGFAGVSVRLYFDNSAEVWKDGQMQGQYTLAGEKKHRHNKNKPAKAQATPAEFTTVLLIPCRGRELLVISSAGGSFTHVFDDIPEGTVSPVITAAESFWIFIPAGTSVDHRVALCQFSEGGTAYSTTSKFRTDPGPAPAGGFQSWLDADLTHGTVALSAADGVGFGAYANNTNGVRIKAVLAGAGGGSPFVYGGRIFTLPVCHDTVAPPGGPTDITKFLVAGGGLQAGDNNTGVTGKLEFFNTPAIEALGATNFGVISRRPFQIIDDDGAVWLDGLLMQPETDVKIVFDAAGKPVYVDENGDNHVETVSFTVRDRLQLAEDHQFYDDVPHDGETLQDAFTEDAKLMGFADDEIHASYFGGYTLPKAGAVTDRKWNVMDKSGDTGLAAIKRLHDNFAANAFFGYDPEGGLQLTSLADASTVEVATLYDSAAMMEELGVPFDSRLLIRSIRVMIVPAEANDIYALGMDYRQRRPILSHKQDYAASNPTTAPGARGLNWAGMPLGYSFESPHLATQAATDWACGLLYDRLTPVRALVEIQCDSKAIYRRGRVLKLELMSDGLPKVLQTLATAPGITAAGGITGTTLRARIKTWNSQLQQVAVPDDNGMAMFPWRPGRYVAQILDGVSDPSSTHTRSTNAKGIREEVIARRMTNMRMLPPEFREVRSAPVLLMNEV